MPFGCVSLADTEYGYEDVPTGMVFNAFRLCVLSGQLNMSRIQYELARGLQCLSAVCP